MARTLTLDVSPPVHRWMNTTLDRDAFKKTVPVLAARVPAAKTGFLLKSDVLKKYVTPAFQGLHLIIFRRSLMDLPKLRSVLRDPHDDHARLVLLNVSEDGNG